MRRANGTVAFTCHADRTGLAFIGRTGRLPRVSGLHRTSQLFNCKGLT